MTIAPPQLHAVVEPWLLPAMSWLPAPTAPPSGWLRLHAQMADAEIAHVLRALVMQNHSGAEQEVPIEAVIEHGAGIMCGGLAAIAGPRSILPSCCCGVEEWRDWALLLSEEDKGGPFLGHDPSPFVERQATGFVVWPDGGLGDERPPDAEGIPFSRAELTTALASVEADLIGFCEAFGRWSARELPAHSAALTAVLRQTVQLPVA